MTSLVRWLLCALIVTAGGTVVAAAQVIPEATVRSGTVIEPGLEELNDDAGRYDIQDVVNQPLASQFRSARGASPPALTRCRWYRFIVKRTLERDGPWVLMADVDSAVLYEPTALGYHAERFGADTPVAARRVQNGLPDVDLRPSDYDRVLYVRINGPTVPVLTFQTLASASEETRWGDLHGVFFGAIFGILCLAAIIFAAITRVRGFVYYAIYMATQTLIQFSGLPLANRLLWPGGGSPGWFISIMYATISPLSFAYFVRFALGTRRSLILDRLLIALGFAGAFATVASWLIDRYAGTNFTSTALPLIYVAMLAVVVGIAFVRWRQRYVSAGFYLLGLAGVAVGFGAFPFVNPSIDTPNLGFVWEAVTFLAAMAYRLVVVTRDRENALAETVAAKEAIADEYALRVAETERFNTAFARFVPREFLEVLGRQDVREVELGDHVERDMTVLFCDIRSFVALSENLTPQATFDFLNLYFGRVGPIVRANDGFIDKYLGDGVMALFPGPPDDAIRAAIALHSEVRRFNEIRAREGGQSIEIGVALHRGPLMLATVGEHERYDTTVIADVVNVAARLEGLTKVYGARIIVSEAVFAGALEAQSYNVRWLGELQVVGSAKPISAFEVCDGDPADMLLQKRSTAGEFAAGITTYRRGDFAASFGIFSDLTRQEPQDKVARFFADRSRRLAEHAIAEWDGVDRHDTKG